MPLLFNLRHLENKTLHLQGELPVADLDLAAVDEVIHPRDPLRYDLEVQKLDDAILVRGRLELTLHCECVRCLKPFDRELVLVDWACHLPLEGEDRVAVLNECVDLTSYIREDSLLAFPQHPLCETECGGLPEQAQNRSQTGGSPAPEKTGSAWSALDQLKL